jgi:hypothetical protein
MDRNSDLDYPYQRGTLPFTKAELIAGLSLGMPVAQAERLADIILRGALEPMGWGLSFDTLILISLASPELESKVETFLRLHAVKLEEVDWLRRREEVKRAIETGDIAPDKGLSE